MGNKISEAFINNEISHEDFIIIINEKRNCRKLIERIRMIENQSDTEKLMCLKRSKSSY